MAVRFDDHDTAIDYLTQELARPGVSRCTAWEVEPTLGSTANRRRSPRIELSDSELVACVANTLVTPLDLSLRGLQFQTTMRLVPGASVVLDLRWRGEKRSLALGRVQWSRFERPSALVEARYRVGAFFETSDFKAIREILDACAPAQALELEIIYGG